MGKLIPLILKKDWWKQFYLFYHRINLLITKTIHSIEKPIIKFSTLIIVPVGRVGSSIFWSFDLWSFDIWSFDLWSFDLWSFYLWSFDLWSFDLWSFDLFYLKKNWLWSNHSRQSFKKIDHDQINLVHL